ncbi:hypothetical protein CC2G_011047 [Coprinopsis cinerea AmutBmut pab1-1]|nr:hypothetical protein CC2G_011047 [Coprinopsis cinerea AmutBmut pab1-1]
MSQQLAQPRPPILSLPVEIFHNIIALANSHPSGISIFEVIKYMQVCRYFYNVLQRTPTLWTHVACVISSPDHVGRFLGGVDQAVANSRNLPLTLRLCIAAQISNDQFSSILRRIASCGSRWEHLGVQFAGSHDPSHAERWFPHLWEMAQAVGLPNQFINVRSLCFDTFMGNTRAVLVQYSADNWNLPQLFPNLRKAMVLSSELSHHLTSTYRLPDQLSQSLEELSLKSVFHNTSLVMVRDILARAPHLKKLSLNVYDNSTFVTSAARPSTALRHTFLEELDLEGDADFIPNQIRSIICPSLVSLRLSNECQDEFLYQGDFVGELLALVGWPACELQSLVLDYVTCLSNESMVRLFAGLPHLNAVKISITTDPGIDERFFAMLWQRSGNGSFLPRLESFEFEVWTTFGHEDYELFSGQSFANFVEDPQRKGSGPFAHLRAAKFTLDGDTVYSSGGIHFPVI